VTAFATAAIHKARAFELRNQFTYFLRHALRSILSPNAAAQPAPQAVGCSGMLSVHVDKFASGMRFRDR
jgi:hypothetical protein